MQTLPHIGTAGNHGDRIRSDCRVELEIRNSGGIDLLLNSKVETLYGASIRELVLDVLDHFRISHAKIRLDDTGALDFVIAARVEAAIKQVLDSENHFFPSSQLKLPDQGMPDRYRFTRLYLPGNTPGLMINAGIHKPDGIILDLEDSVAPDRKKEARILVRNALSGIDFHGAERMVRINPLPEGLSDIEYVVPQCPDLILLPKTEDPDQVVNAGKRIHEMIKESGKSRQVFLMPIIETALGVEKAFEIARASGDVVAMAIGLEDYTADMGVTRTGEGEESFYARSRLVNACKAAGIQPIDSVFGDVDDEEGLKKTALKSRALGFEGMGCIHPRQIRPAREAYLPTPEETKLARQIILAFEQAQKAGHGVVSLGSKMIDPPVVKRAQRTLELALQTGRLDRNWRDEHE